MTELIMVAVIDYEDDQRSEMRVAEGDADDELRAIAKVLCGVTHTAGTAATSSPRYRGRAACVAA
jgi:hypothetical protein